MPQKQRLILNLILLGLNTVLGAGYPQVGSVIGLVGSILGLNLMYIIPIAVYLKRYLLEISEPKLVEALDWNRIKSVRHKNKFTTPKIAIFEEPTSDEESQDDIQSGRRATKNTPLEEKIQQLRNKLERRRNQQNRIRPRFQRALNANGINVLNTPGSAVESALSEGLLTGVLKPVHVDYTRFYIS